MATAAMHSAMGQLRRMIGKIGAAELSDPELLERYAQDRDEAAFEVLVWRHGTLVWNVCRRVLDEHEAEDAFQATFLTLVRKGDCVVKTESLASWLYKVAHRIAIAARLQASQRAKREQRAQPAPADGNDDVQWREMRPVIDAEIERLPDKYRTPFVLCYLEGKTTTEAARELGCPAGTVGTRLAWARERMRTRLTQRGLTLSAAGLAALLTHNLASAAVPLLAVSTAVQLALGGCTVPASILTLSEGAVKAMLFAKLKVYAIGALTAFCLLSAGGWWYFDSSHESASAAPIAASAAPAVAPDQPQAAPQTVGDKKVEPIKNDAAKVGSFTAIVMKGVGKVIIVQADTDSVKAVGNDKLAKWRVENGTLHLEGVTDFAIGIKELASVQVPGVGTVVANDVRCKRLAVVLKTGATIRLTGSAESLDLTVAGAGTFHGEGFKVKQASVNMTGPARATVYATEKLTGNVGGPGMLMYAGTPKVDVAAPIPAVVRPAQGAPVDTGAKGVSNNKKDGPAKEEKKTAPTKPAAVKLSATVDGYTQATQFNPQKYPFKYMGTSQLDAEELRSLSKPGEVPAATTKALLACLLWPKENDSLVKASVKSDGKKLTGDAEVLHKYGAEGTHTLKLKLDGTIDDGKLSLRVVETVVSGTWSFGGGGVVLKGEATIKIDSH